MATMAAKIIAVNHASLVSVAERKRNATRRTLRDEIVHSHLNMIKFNVRFGINTKI